MDPTGAARPRPAGEAVGVPTPRARLAPMAVAVIAVGSGCFDPRPSTGGACAPGDRCPDPLQCIANVCVQEGDILAVGRDAGFVDGRPGDLVCPPGYAKAIPGVASCYRVVSFPTGWISAESLCEQDGAHLLIPDSAAEAMFAASPSWLGISDRKVQNRVISVIGRPLTFTQWQPDEPSNSMFDCAHVASQSQWTMGPCDFPFPYTCEFDGSKADPTAY
jgi:Lectin C-type domain